MPHAETQQVAPLTMPSHVDAVAGMTVVCWAGDGVMGVMGVMGGVGAGEPRHKPNSALTSANAAVRSSTSFCLLARALVQGDEAFVEQNTDSRLKTAIGDVLDILPSERGDISPRRGRTRARRLLRVWARRVGCFGVTAESLRSSFDLLKDSLK